MALNRNLDFIQKELRNIRNQNLYRELKYGEISGPYIKFNKKRAINLSSNDYLALASKKMQVQQMQSSSRLIAGNDPFFKKLEEKLATHKQKQASLVFPTGYMTNLGVISSLARKGDTIFSDELNHASIIESCKLAGASIIIYKHNDYQDLESKIRKIKNRKFVITEGVFSMDGDLANLKEITSISEKNDGIIILDDAHGDFVYGKDGAGSGVHNKVQNKIDFYISSLSKGLGSFGGYVASNKTAIEYFVNKSKTFIYTSALPSILVENALQRLNLNREKNRKKLFDNIKKISNGLKTIGFEVNSPSHIIPIIIGDEKTTLKIGYELLEEGLFVQPIRYPTVPKHTSRLRISVTSWLDENHIENSLEIFERIGKRNKII